jgi:hypothetical protein
MQTKNVIFCVLLDTSRFNFERLLGLRVSDIKTVQLLSQSNTGLPNVVRNSSTFMTVLNVAMEVVQKGTSILEQPFL